MEQKFMNEITIEFNIDRSAKITYATIFLLALIYRAHYEINKQLQFEWLA